MCYPQPSQEELQRLIEIFSEEQETPQVPGWQITWQNIKPALGFKGWFSIPVKQPETLYLSDEVCCKIFQGIDTVELTLASSWESNNKSSVAAWINSVGKIN
ncbi:hypothetical protein PGT21_003192 [Puccinia graminis f. sp. tritici]|uniref:Uncharacterized protein n=1 Tax=Puccinia graminis f. sp. tritici TaxID=56615 RepID=A0A5B0MUR9_PUCGR|nr:hypothetical protein PGT21_003192 [Puccinia graminis f. sp. tritici]KAA1120376.1 hypothetical protein PGTUg99_003872 [Puccinia graminis f. sp. tritici]